MLRRSLGISQAVRQWVLVPSPGVRIPHPQPKIFMNSKKSKFIIFLLSAIFCVFVLYSASAFYIKNIGITLKTDENFDYSSELEYFLQTDPEWASAKLGTSNYTLAQQGCTITDVAMVLNYLGYETNPALLNQQFTEDSLYDENGNLLWFKLEDLYPVQYKHRRIFSSKTIEKNLRNEILPIVKVKLAQWDLEHWVLIVGADGEDFLVMDPLNKNKTVTKLSDYGKVYAYRAIM